MPHRHSRLGPAYNLRGAVFMVLSMAGFAVEDSLLKVAAASLPPGQILITFGVLGTAAFALLSILAREAPLTRAMLSRPLVLRSLSEVTGRLFFMLAIALTPLSTASAILQATPLVVMTGAALLFGGAGALGPALQSVGVTQGYYLFNAAPYLLTLVIMIATCSPTRTLAGAPGELSITK